MLTRAPAFAYVIAAPLMAVGLFLQTSPLHARGYVETCAKEYGVRGAFRQDAGSYYVYPAAGGSEHDADTLNACIQKYVAADLNNGSRYVKTSRYRKSGSSCPASAPILYKGGFYCPQ